jgi:hypothetical protein
MELSGNQQRKPLCYIDACVDDVGAESWMHQYTAVDDECRQLCAAEVRCGLINLHEQVAVL